jgi:peptidoglycan/LPS O-acetylase OafA/YrhL
VLAWSYQPETSRRLFYGRRVARVWPLHLLTWAAALAIAVLVEKVAVSPSAAVANVMLVQAWIPKTGIAFSINQVSWSLSCEAFFYATFPFAIVWAMAQSNRRLVQAMGLMSALLAVAIAATMALGLSDYLLFYANPLGRSYQFMLGIVLAVFIRRGLLVRMRVGTAALISLGWLAILTVVATWGGHLHGFGARHWPADLAVVPFAALLIAVAASSDLERAANEAVEGSRRRRRAPRASMFASRSVVRLGEWSFALYLCHYLVLRIGSHVLDPAELGGSGKLLFSTALIIVSIAVSGLLYSLFERPVERAIRLRLPATPSAASPAAVPVASA